MNTKTMLIVGLALMLGLVRIDALEARPYVLIDARDGTVLSQNQAFDRWYPASLTKMLTAYVVFEAVKSGEITMKSPVRVSKYALTKPPSKMGFPVGTILNFENAMKIIMVKSANDVAVAIAESLSGSESDFAVRMNETAARIGMTDSNFVNPHGLFDPRQYSTARDLGLLAMALYRDFPQYTYMMKIPALSYGKKLLKSFNSLLGRYNGADGIKTGYVCASGFNIAASANRSGRRLIAIILGAKSAHERGILTARLLNTGFDAPIVESNLKLAELEPYGTSRFEALNLKDQLCKRKKRNKNETRKQRAEKWKAEAARRKAENALYFMPRAPFNPIPIRLGNATGPSPIGIVVPGGKKRRSNIPIPTPRPLQETKKSSELLRVTGTNLRDRVSLSLTRLEAVSN